MGKFYTKMFITYTKCDCNVTVMRQTSQGDFYHTRHNPLFPNGLWRVVARREPLTLSLSL